MTENKRFAHELREVASTLENLAWDMLNGELQREDVKPPPNPKEVEALEESVKNLTEENCRLDEKICRVEELCGYWLRYRTGSDAALRTICDTLGVEPKNGKWPERTSEDEENRKLRETLAEVRVVCLDWVRADATSHSSLRKVCELVNIIIDDSTRRDDAARDLCEGEDG